MIPTPQHDVFCFKTKIDEKKIKTMIKINY